MTKLLSGIQAYIENLEHTSFEEDLVFLDDVGGQLLRLKRLEFKMGYIYKIELLIEEITIKFLNNRESNPTEYRHYSEDFMLFLGKTKALAQDLATKAQNRKLTEEEGYYKIFRLGYDFQKLYNFANTFILPLMVLTKTIPFQ